MISVEEAKRILMGHVRPLPFTPLELDLALDHHLATDVLSRVPHPLFDMSAVDGWALCGEGPVWSSVGEVAAGQQLERTLVPGECARIFTGARIPDGTDRVLMQEDAVRAADAIRTVNGAPDKGANIRRRGEQFTEGELLARAGDRLDPPLIGLLATAGLEEIEVIFKPWVAIVRTGGEFIDDDASKEGRIYSSNDRMLLAALHKELCETDDEGAFTAGDDDAELEIAIRQASAADVVITTGGVSVGDHDRVETVLRKMGARIVFHGVAQKPGKPLLIALLEGKPVFGLPGNPRAVMILYLEYVLPFLRAMQGAPDPWPRTERLPLEHAVDVKGGRAEFRAARIERGRVRLLVDEGSHMLRSLTAADALVYLPADRRAWHMNDEVEVHYLPR